MLIFVKLKIWNIKNLWPFERSAKDLSNATLLVVLAFIYLEMAQEWMKTLPCSILQFNWIQKVLKRSSSLWRALTFKRFELQIWDWSWMKENSKIFENTLKKKVQNNFFSLFLWTNKKVLLFQRGFYSLDYLLFILTSFLNE